MKVFVDSPGLASTGARLTASQAPPAPQAAIPPGADPVSQGTFSQWEAKNGSR